MIELDTAINVIYKTYLLNFYLHIQSILIGLGDGRDTEQQYWAN